MKTRLEYCSLQDKLEDSDEKKSHGMRKVPFLSEIVPTEKTETEKNFT